MSTTPGDTTTVAALDHACELVAGACSQLAQRTDYAASSAVLRAQEVVALLRDCGADGPQSVLTRDTPTASLRAAAAVLDAITDQDRPPLLGSARTELASVLATLQQVPPTGPPDATGGAR